VGLHDRSEIQNIVSDFSTCLSTEAFCGLGGGKEMKKKEPVCFIIAGPNGAGKTTFAQEFLPQEARCPLFVNADLIAAGLSPFAPGETGIRAGRLMVEEIASHVRRRDSFAFETTLRGGSESDMKWC